MNILWYAFIPFITPVMIYAARSKVKGDVLTQGSFSFIEFIVRQKFGFLAHVIAWALFGAMVGGLILAGLTVFFAIIAIALVPRTFAITTKGVVDSTFYYGWERFKDIKLTENKLRVTFKKKCIPNPINFPVNGNLDGIEAAVSKYIPEIRGA